MLRQYLIGAAASICNIAIHALVMVAVIKVTRIADELATKHQTLRLIVVMIAAVTVLMMAHLAEVLVWSFTYATFRVAPEGSDIVYFAFVNYTTLGYGDVTPVERWHLLGPMTAMNGGTACCCLAGLRPWFLRCCESRFWRTTKAKSLGGRSSARNTRPSRAHQRSRPAGTLR
jgi:ion channel